MNWIYSNRKSLALTILIILSILLLKNSLPLDG
jgi:hypothetical protein